jgi:uncharacterized protein (TIGR03437 family)
MHRIWPALAILVCGIARGAAPSYSAAAIVSTASYAPGTFAPNTLVSIFGSGLAMATHAVVASDLSGGFLPTNLAGAAVYLDDQPAPLLFVSEGQINFLIPGKQGNQPTAVRVVREGQSGPEVMIAITDATPALFVSNDYAIATHADNTLITPDKPASGGELIVIYATGLGKANPMPSFSEAPHALAQLVNLAALKVTVDGVTIDPARVLYAGLTPESFGLYQINAYLPETIGTDPELRVFIGDAASQAGLKLPAR